jgi:hypothetical protein
MKALLRRYEPDLAWEQELGELHCLLTIEGRASMIGSKANQP